MRSDRGARRQSSVLGGVGLAAPTLKISASAARHCAVPAGDVGAQSRKTRRSFDLDRDVFRLTLPKARA
jgi:hypothetical protein